jgi:hypothetical protein
MTTLAAELDARGAVFKAWFAYAIASLVLLATVAGLATLMVSAEVVPALWVSAGIAYGLQLLGFAGLVMVRDRAQLFLAGWLIGMALRFGAVGGVAWWLSRSAALPREAALLSLAAFVFLLLMLEPIFLRWDLRKS